jgi:peptide/nickel transport system substrate-binding protein
MADSNAMVLGLKGGGIDGATLTGAWMQQLDPARFYIVPGFSASVQLLALNNAHKPLDEPRVRAAISYGVDIQEIIDAAFQGEGTPSGSPLIPGLSDYYEKSLAMPYPLDRERARDLLSQAGYGDEQKLSLEITVPSSYTMHVDTGQVIASQLEKIGIQTSIKQVEWGTWFSEVYQNRRYEATVISLDAVNVSPRSFLSRYHSGSASNFINYANAGFDRVYDAAIAESDTEKRVALYKEAQRIISEDAASVFLQDITGFTVLRGGAYGGVLNYPLYAIDFASMYGIEPD